MLHFHMWSLPWSTQWRRRWVQTRLAHSGELSLSYSEKDFPKGCEAQCWRAGWSRWSGTMVHLCSGHPWIVSASLSLVTSALEWLTTHVSRVFCRWRGYCMHIWSLRYKHGLARGSVNIFSFSDNSINKWSLLFPPHHSVSNAALRQKSGQLTHAGQHLGPSDSGFLLWNCLFPG